jgi:hypothetical protein
MIIRCPILATVALASSSIIRCAEPHGFCQPPPEIENAFQKASAASAAVTDPFAALDRAAPFLAVRDQYPDSLFAHERYQDAIHEHGIEGHLQLLAKQYTELESRHSGDPVYHYLWLRAIVGRTTPAAIRGLNQLIADNPSFAPAYRTLAEIYGTQAFHNPEREAIEKKNFLALCPGGAFTRRPPPIPPPSTLIDAAARQLDQSAQVESDTCAKIVTMTIQGLKEFEWRSQRIRAFDWYSRDYKLQDARDLRAKYWEAWPVQVRAYRKAGQLEMAGQLLTAMEQRALPLRYQPGSAYWDAIEVLARLYAEDHQSERVLEKLKELEKLLSETQDPDQKSLRAARLGGLRNLATAASASRGSDH